VPNDPLADTANMAACYVTVAAVAVPLGVVSWLLSRPGGWAWRPRRTRWTGFDVVGFGLGFVFVSSVVGIGLVATGVELPTKWVPFVAVPVLAWAAWALPHAGRQPLRVPWRDLPTQVFAGVVTWAVITPLAHVTNAAANLLLLALGREPAEHPLAKQGIGDTALSAVVFGVSVCLLTPFAEEVLFRGLPLRWAAERRHRPWLLVVPAGLFAALGFGEHGLFPLGFALLLALDLAILQRGRDVWKRFPDRTAASVWATSTLFAAAHSLVWPTPVPLFVLAVGLGYVTARTGNVVAGTVAHGLFNAVSFAYLLRQ
jgi:membrane protease YdiL (CAAX protease family)